MDLIPAQDSYPFQGFTMTPSAAALLIKQRFAGKVVHRREIVDDVSKTHLQLGGVDGGANRVATVKKALQNLAGLGEAKNLAMKGYWTIGASNDKMIPSASSEQDKKTKADCTLSATSDSHIEQSSYHVIGQGEECVYLYWYPSFEELARVKNEKQWKCKLGRSTRDAMSRINEQCGTSSPEAPCIGLVIKSDKSQLLEKVLHDVLKFKTRHLSDGIGKEWFITSPNEVLSIYYFLLS